MPTPANRSARTLVRGLVDAILPQTCCACGTWISGGAHVCPDCHSRIAAEIARPHCPHCGRTLPRSAIHDKRCAHCRIETFWNVAGIARVGLYQDQLQALLSGLKYRRGRERNAEYLANWLATALRNQSWLPDIEALVPVPMHWIRRAQRPCDHALLLAEALSRRINVPVLRVVRRPRYALSQVGITTRAQRFANVKDCFTPVHRLARRVAGRTVCIIDNLLVTGATVCEVSKVLRRAGAKRIYAAVLARPSDHGGLATLPSSDVSAVPALRNDDRPGPDQDDDVRD